MAREKKPIEGTYPEGSRASLLGNGSTEVPSKKRDKKRGKKRGKKREARAQGTMGMGEGWCAPSCEVGSKVNIQEVTGTGLGPGTGRGSAFGGGKARDCRELKRAVYEKEFAEAVVELHEEEPLLAPG